jgi:RNA polymerase sigma-70 factor (ECF subfamily)
MDETVKLVTRARDERSTFAARQHAFGELVGCYQDMAFGCAYAFLRDYFQAEEAAQEAFITAWQRLSQLQQPSTFASWLRSIVISRCHRLIRGKQAKLVSLDSANHVQAPGDLDDEMAARDLKRSVTNAINRLPHNQRMAVTLFYINEYSHEQIGEFLSVPRTTVAKRLHTARNRLKEILVKGFQEEISEFRPSRSRSFAGKVRAGIFNTYVGTYQFERRPELIATIRIVEDRLISEAAGQLNELCSNDDSDTELSTKEYDGKGKFSLNEHGEVTHFIYYEFGRELGRARKIGAAS